MDKQKIGIWRDVEWEMLVLFVGNGFIRSETSVNIRGSLDEKCSNVFVGNGFIRSTRSDKHSGPSNGNTPDFA